MKLFLYNSSSEQVDEIVAQLHKYKDGDVVSQMKNKGCNYKLNFGVSGMVLRQLAKNYTPNNEVAQRLWFREIRETLLLATLIADPQTLTIDQIQNWSTLLTENELVEYMGNFLLCKSPLINELASLWISDVNTNKQAAIFIALSKAMANKAEVRKGNDLLMSFVLDQKDSSAIFLQRAMGRFLRSYCRFCTHGIKEVKNILSKYNTLGINEYLVAELETELMFLED